MKALSFPKYPIKLKKKDDSTLQIFDEVRKKWLQLTPEEWVRQHWIHHLISELKVPISMILVENQFKLDKRIKRTDITVWKNGKNHLIIECKAADIPISENTLSQILNYQRYHQATYLILSNGIQHFYFFVDPIAASIRAIEHIPNYQFW